MGSSAYNLAIDYAIQVLKTIKDSGYEMDYLHEQFVNVSIQIGRYLARTDASIDQEEINKCKSFYEMLYDRIKLSVFQSI